MCCVNEQASIYFEHAKASGRQLKYWQLTSDATRGQSSDASLVTVAYAQ